jgi:hypothetical protein
MHIQHLLHYHIHKKTKSKTENINIKKIYIYNINLLRDCTTVDICSGLFIRLRIGSRTRTGIGIRMRTNILMVMDKNKAFIKQYFPNFKGARQLIEDKYIVEKNYRYYTVDTTLQEVAFTLDNAKFWYIKFVCMILCISTLTCGRFIL